MLDVVFQDHFGRVVDGGFDGGKLNQHFAAIAAIFHHAFDGLHVADGPGQAVQNGLGVLMGMGVGVAVIVSVLVHMAVVLMSVLVDSSIWCYVSMCMGMFTHFFILFRSAPIFSGNHCALSFIFISIHILRICRSALDAIRLDIMSGDIISYPFSKNNPAYGDVFVIFSCFLWISHAAYL